MTLPGWPSDGALPSPERDAVVVYLHAGQLFASAEACTISTIVGSCVAVCLFDPGRRIGGANHYLLPHRFDGERANARFGQFAIDALVARMLALGCDERGLQAKIFGGASMLAPSRAPASTLGMQNVATARASLAAHRIPILAEDVGGDRGRKLLFRTDEGHAWIRTL